MRLYLFFCTVLAISCAAFSSLHAQSRPSADCPEINVKAEIKNSHDGGLNGEVSIKFENPREADQYHVVLTCVTCGQPRKAVDLAFKDLKAGLYDIYVIAKNGCVKQLNIQVN